MKVLLLYVSASASACAKLNEPDFPAELISATRAADNSVHVQTDRYTMDFAAPPKVQMPESFTLLNQSRNILGSDSCAFESLVGIAMFPAANASADRQGQNLVNEGDIQVEAAGPFIAKVTVTYGLQYDCFNMMQTLRGQTNFTFFPSGRIVRRDIDVVPSTTVLPSGTGSCGCSPGFDPVNNPPSYFFTSYWAFDATGATMTDNNDAVVMAGMTTEGGAYACTTFAQGGAVGVAWSDGNTRLFPNSTAAHIYDFADRGTPTFTPTPPGNVTSAVQVAANCAEARTGLDDPPLLIDGVRFNTSGPDGIYRDDTTHQEPFVITPAQMGRFIPGGFAISLDVDGHATVKVERASGAGTDGGVFVQREGETRSLFYFSDPLNFGDTITIEPQ